MENFCIVYAHSIIEDGEKNQYAATQVMWAKNKRIVAIKVEEALNDDEEDDSVVIQASILAFVGANIGRDAEHLQLPLLNFHDARFIIDESNEEYETNVLQIDDVKYINCVGHQSLGKIKELVRQCELHSEVEITFF